MSVAVPTRQPSADPDSEMSARSSRVSLDIRLSSIEVRLPPDDRLLFRISDYLVPTGARVLIGGASGLGKTTLILGFSACAIGGALDGLAFPWLRGLMGSALPSRDLVACPVYQSAPVWGTAVVATVLAVFIPLFRLYRQDIHNSLRGL